MQKLGCLYFALCGRLSHWLLPWQNSASKLSSLRKDVLNKAGLAGCRYQDRRGGQHCDSFEDAIYSTSGNARCHWMWCLLDRPKSMIVIGLNNSSKNCRRRVRISKKAAVRWVSDSSGSSHE